VTSSPFSHVIGVYAKNRTASSGNWRPEDVGGGREKCTERAPSCPLEAPSRSVSRSKEDVPEQQQQQQQQTLLRQITRSFPLGEVCSHNWSLWAVGVPLLACQPVRRESNFPFSVQLSFILRRLSFAATDVLLFVTSTCNGAF